MNPLGFGVIFALLSVTIPSYSATINWGPWSENKEAPVIGEGSPCDEKTEPDAWNPFVRFLGGAVHVFQQYISPVDGDRCSMAPTCSHYSIQALQKHGASLGFMMSADRIVHEYEEQRFVPVLRDGMRSRFYDPIENNDFWFAEAVRHDPPESRRTGE
ncbi:MAG: membrane protein insertion efficiency factor YidD [Nitrospirae bacterium CG_4_9_14_3_um_filter_53_35]|nr:MAG: hypothetical protein AUK29_07840 [Nitrospirae bacterium CG2_30_53_67]PIS38290.1 MAG: membrane protein insertion efficiency factor YidD [Nitrospirae bacterium CG08_land_8_20_14_0_20_52_24]PIV85343.1 MAG: membrane protein insertion efficiency factor YidD [Nitrospirae bacterium CG17_big_fil_post_rev_8_21_14_2_50_50_9]PIW85324.1 MAG: membrane protein insertion efficiency factor YidD [Nitrospirae bacterium CG_4_8_14_3_um_filter_50_41]PIX85626.1 MAG: membrane protein insertion efficiency fact